MSTERKSFSRTLVNYNISNPFVFYISKKFCDAYLPCHDKDVILVDEREEEYKVKFLIKGRTFSRGWRDFIIEHGLQEGDILSFNMTGRCKFEVHITRAGRIIKNDFQDNVPVGFGKKDDLAEENTCLSNTVAKKYLVPCVIDSHQKDIMLYQNKKRVHEEVVSKEKVYIKSRSTGITGADGNLYANFHDCPNIAGHTRIIEKELPAINVSEALLGSDYESTPLEGQSVSIEYSESALSFKSFEDFRIAVNGETLDSEIPQDFRMKYYQLCCGQKKLIHDCVVKGLNSKFAVAVIIEIVRIADSTKAATISTSHHLEGMGKTLQSFEDLGFAVGFLRAKIGTLTIFSDEHQRIDKSVSMMSEMEREMTAFQEKWSKIDKLIESAMTQYAELLGNLKVKIDALKERREKLRFVFSKVARLTW